MELEKSDKSLLIFPNGEIVKDFVTHFDILKEKYKKEFLDLSKKGFSQLEAYREIFDNLIKDGCIRIGVIRADFYCTIWELGKREKEIILDWCKSFLKIHNNVYERKWTLTIHQNCGNKEVLEYYLKDIIENNYLRL
jgi:hypothetical protein